MASKGEQAYAALSAAVDGDEAVGEWFRIDQDRINAFADVTDDHQFIHVDPERCRAESPWGVPIAHGFLTLSLLPALRKTVPLDPARTEGVAVSINYGCEKVRFVSPVKVGSRIRARVALSAVDQKDPRTLQITDTFTVEIDGESKPAVVAQWVTRLVYE